jgi:5-methylcytosine-specific restriction endonuclease McrA
MPNDSFYTCNAWRKLREYKLSINTICEKNNCKNIATEVHHIKDRKDYPELELEIENLQSLCKPCHSGHTAKESNKKREWKPYKLKYE